MDFTHPGKSRPFLQLIALLALLAAGWLIYLPGLDGPFILDDEPNLQSLPGATANPDATQGLLEFITRGHAGPTGRPVSLASLYLDGLSGTKDARHFKRTNVLIHLLNTALILLLFRKLAPAWLTPAEQGGLALFASALWALHPLSVSTTLYVVQRMALLMTLFSLCAVLGYLYGRQRLATNRRAGHAIMSLSMIFFGSLAVLAKENGALIPLYCLAIELTLARQWDRHHAPPATAWKWLFLYLPPVLLAAALATRWESMAATYDNIRNFTLGERLSTQLAVLADYLRAILVPSLDDGSVFHDDYPVLPLAGKVWGFALLHASLLAGAIAVRARHPVFAFAVFWFYAGHLMESSVLPLELYFEHRNYLPMAGLLFAAAYYGYTWLRPWRSAALATGALVLVLFSLLLWQQTSLWGNQALLAEVSARNHPDSVRAQQFLAARLVQDGYSGPAERILRELHRKYPGHAGVLAQVVQLSCLNQRPDPDILDQLVQEAQRAPYDNSLMATLPRLIQMGKPGKCLEHDYLKLIDVVTRLRENPAYRPRPVQADLYYMEGRLWELHRDLNAAMLALDKAFRYRKDPNIPLLQAVWLMTADLPEDALRYVEKAEAAARDTRWSSSRELRNIFNMRQTVNRRIQKRPAGAAPAV